MKYNRYFSMVLLLMGCAHWLTSQELPLKSEGSNDSKKILLSASQEGILSLAEFKQIFDNLRDTREVLSFDEANKRFGPSRLEPHEVMSGFPNAKYQVKEGGTIMVFFAKLDGSQFFMTSAFYSDEKGKRQVLFSKGD